MNYSINFALSVFITFVLNNLSTHCLLSNSKKKFKVPDINIGIKKKFLTYQRCRSYGEIISRVVWINSLVEVFPIDTHNATLRMSYMRIYASFTSSYSSHETWCNCKVLVTCYITAHFLHFVLLLFLWFCF